jgi:hypothetical protein
MYLMVIPIQGDGGETGMPAFKLSLVTEEVFLVPPRCKKRDTRNRFLTLKAGIFEDYSLDFYHPTKKHN